MKGFMFFLLFFSFNSLATNQQRLNQLSQMNRFAFGSCNNQHHDQPLWKNIQSQAPDLFIWGGDNVYAETTNPDLIKTAYDTQNQNPDYQNFKSITPIIGTWDDHDFAHDQATGLFTHKMISQNHALDFYEEPKNSLRRKQEGIYTSYEFGPENKKVKFIILDNRYFKGLDADALLLGKKQWAWLEEEFKNSKAQVHFVITGLSVASPRMAFGDEWADTPGELERFLNLKNKYNPKGLVVLSGDKHFSSIFQNHGLLEFMSSGMTHTVPTAVRRYFTGKYPNLFFGLSYGLVEIDWNKNNPIITMMIKNRIGASIFTKRFEWLDKGWQEL